jgi:DNA-binding transcriptional regulator GbsR (MarR family)
MELDAVTQKFILHWGEMGARWGVNRTVAQIHALLFLAERPLHAEEIADTLGIARSNVSTSLKELQSWGLAQVAHELGDRRDYFVTFKDIKDVARAVVEGKKKRELDPTLTVLRECLLQVDETTPAAVRAKVAGSLEFLEALDGWYEEVRTMSPTSWLQLMKMGAKVQVLLKKRA